MKLDRDKFWEGYHDAFDAYGPTTQATVDALNGDLDKFEAETRIHGIAQYSYVLATEYHETGINGNHFVPVREGRSRPGTPGRKNQDRYWLTGFYGRGKVQTTWREKYLAIGQLCGVSDLFVKSPDLLLENGWAYEAMVAGMSHGIYRSDGAGKFTLDRMLHGDTATLIQYREAREIINGDKAKNSLMIAGYAKHFEEILTASQTLSATALAAIPATNQNDSGSVDELPDTASPTATDEPAVDQSQDTQPPTLDNPPPPAEITAPVAVVASPGIFSRLWSKVDSAGDKIQNYQATLEKFQGIPTTPSGTGTKTLTVLGTIWAGVMFVCKIIYADRFEFLAGSVVIAIAVLYFWHRSRERNNPVGALPAAMIAAVPSVSTDPPSINITQTNEAS